MAKVVEPNKNEANYNRMVLGGNGRYEPFTLRLTGGLKYTPDYMTHDASGRITLHEVKGGYRLGSHRGAAAAFKVAVSDFPEFSFVWASWDGERFNQQRFNDDLRR